VSAIGLQKRTSPARMRVTRCKNRVASHRRSRGSRIAVLDIRQGQGQLVSVVVETAKDALSKLAELADSGHTEVLAKDFLGKVIDVATLRAETEQAP
jgi:2-polyprenyl-3-methyl-5-hydroxy-6-metoxy-1,4-benzoquinol methylase